MIPDEDISNFVKLGMEHNAATCVVIQGSWYPFDVAPPEAGAPDKYIKDNAQRDHAKIEDLQAATDEWRTRMEKHADALNQQYGTRCVYIVHHAGTAQASAKAGLGHCVELPVCGSEAVSYRGSCD